MIWLVGDRWERSRNIYLTQVLLIDELVKSPIGPIIVIPAKTGIQ